MAEQMLLLSAGLSVGFLSLLLLTLMMCYLWRRRWRKQSQYQELSSPMPSVPTCSAPVILVSQCTWTTPGEIPFTLPPPLTTHKRSDLEMEEKNETEVKVETQQDILAHRGSLCVRSWYPVGTVHAGLYSSSPLKEVVAPPPGMATRLCFSVEYRHSGEQLMVTLFRLGNLPPRFHRNVTLVELRLLPDDRRPRQAKARGTGPDPEFSDCFIFQVSAVCVLQSTLSVCVLSVEQDCKRHPVGKILFPLDGELSQGGRVLWKDLDTTDDTKYSEQGDVQISLNYSPTQQRLSVGVLGTRGLQVLTDTGVCVQVSLQIHTQVVKMKRTSVVKGESDPCFDQRMNFKLRSQHLDEACLRFELQQPHHFNTEASLLLGGLVLGPFMFAKGPQLQHWMDMVNRPQETVEQWHRLSRAT